MRHLSGDHLAALTATALAAAALVAIARRRGAALAVPLGRALAAVMLAAFMTEQLTYGIRGTWSARLNLPLQLTDAVTLVSIAALWRPRAQRLVELVYFWALTASLQAVLTPDVDQRFPDVLYFTYFATHSGAVLAACLLVMGLGQLPRPGALWRVYGVTAAFTALATIGTVATGGNYMFLRHKPRRGSVLDLIGPWPWYIVSGAVVGLAMFLALDALAARLRAR